jgi:capsular polysaccharide biosynthesis protein
MLLDAHPKYATRGFYDARQHVRAARILWFGSPWPYNFYHWIFDFVLPCLTVQSGDVKSDPLTVVFGFRLNHFQVEWMGFLGHDAWVESRISGVFSTSGEAFVINSGDHVRAPLALNVRASLKRNILRHKPTNQTRLREKFRIYLARGLGTRSGGIWREDRLQEKLSTQLGFQIVRPWLETQVSIAHKLSEAEVIVSVHGSQLTNMIFVKPGCKIVEILFSDPFDEVGTKDCFEALAQQWEHKHYYYRGASLRFLRGNYTAVEIRFEDFASYLRDTVLS